jgi:hypothetical protein
VVSTSDGSTNGVTPHPADAPSPDEIVDLAASCVRFVERATKIALDGSPETLPILDHYLKGSANPAAAREEARELVVLAAGAYLGEIVRKRYPSWWRLEDGLVEARIELRDVFLAFSPMQMVRDALDAYMASDEGERDNDAAVFELDDADRPDVEMRLAELPAVPPEEYYAPSTRLEVLDIAVDAIRTKRIASGDPELALEPEDYD